MAFAGASYHLAQIQKLLQEDLAPPYEPAADTDAERIARGERWRMFHWHLRAFFWELLGAFELMLMWANDHFGMGVPEREVTVDALSRGTAMRNQTDWPRTYQVLEAAWLSEWLFEIRMYRHFAHRSFLGVKMIVRKEGGSTMLLPRTRDGQVYVPQAPDDLQRYLAEMRALGGAVFPS